MIILTNDGELTKLLTQGGKVAKVYHVKVKGSPGDQHIERLRKGVKLDEKRTAPSEIKLIERTKEGGNNWYEVTLHQGKNQQIRRMFDSIHHSVTKLRRVRIRPLTDEGLAVGQHRELTSREINRFFQKELRRSPWHEARGEKAKTQRLLRIALEERKILAGGETTGTVFVRQSRPGRAQDVELFLRPSRARSVWPD